MHRILRNNLWLDATILMVNFTGAATAADSHCKTVFEATNWHTGPGSAGAQSGYTGENPTEYSPYSQCTLPTKL